MSKHELLEEGALRVRLGSLPGWHFEKNAVVKKFEFADFDATMAFVNKLADLARERDHHPELLVREKTCEVRLTTHDAGGVTQADLDGVGAIDNLRRG